MSIKVSKYFKWFEALFLPQWNRVADFDDGLDDHVESNLRMLFSKMDQLREYFNAPIVIHCAFRPVKYNSLPSIKGAPDSAHIYGMAADWSITGINCDDLRSRIIDNNLLETLQMRMEDRPGSDWVHLDIREPSPGHPRFFKP